MHNHDGMARTVESVVGKEEDNRTRGTLGRMRTGDCSVSSVANKFNFWVYLSEIVPLAPQARLEHSSKCAKDTRGAPRTPEARQLSSPGCTCTRSRWRSRASRAIRPVSYRLLHLPEMA